MANTGIRINLDRPRHMMVDEVGTVGLLHTPQNPEGIQVNEVSNSQWGYLNNIQITTLRDKKLDKKMRKFEREFRKIGFQRSYDLMYGGDCFKSNLLFVSIEHSIEWFSRSTNIWQNPSQIEGTITSLRTTPQSRYVYNIGQKTIYDRQEGNRIGWVEDNIESIIRFMQGVEFPNPNKNRWEEPKQSIWENQYWYRPGRQIHHGQGLYQQMRNAEEAGRNSRRNVRMHTGEAGMQAISEALREQMTVQEVDFDMAMYWGNTRINESPILELGTPGQLATSDEDGHFTWRIMPPDQPLITEVIPETING